MIIKDKLSLTVAASRSAFKFKTLQFTQGSANFIPPPKNQINPNPFRLHSQTPNGKHSQWHQRSTLLFKFF